MLDPPTRDSLALQVNRQLVVTTSPRNWPSSLRPRKLIMSVAPKYSVLYWHNLGISSSRSARLRKSTSVECSDWAVTL
jgi:hypothetical protein